MWRLLICGQGASHWSLLTSSDKLPEIWIILLCFWSCVCKCVCRCVCMCRCVFELQVNQPISFHLLNRAIGVNPGVLGGRRGGCRGVVDGS